MNSRNQVTPYLATPDLPDRRWPNGRVAWFDCSHVEYVLVVPIRRMAAMVSRPAGVAICLQDGEPKEEAIG